MKFPVVIRPGEDGWSVAECPAVPGAISQGKTRGEALENIAEAIALMLEPIDPEHLAPGSELASVAVSVAA